MSYCSECGKYIEADWKFCPVCGRSRRPEICPSCGTVLEPDWEFCPECGFDVNVFTEEDKFSFAFSEADTGVQELLQLTDKRILSERRNRLKEEFHELELLVSEQNRSEEEGQRLTPEARQTLMQKRLELRSRQGKCHNELLTVTKQLRRLYAEEAKRAKEKETINRE